MTPPEETEIVVRLDKDLLVALDKERAFFNRCGAPMSQAEAIVFVLWDALTANRK